MSTTTLPTSTQITMRSPEYSGGSRRPPEHFENEYYQYLKPESFTVLPPETHPAVPSPPKAPEPYKLTPRKRHKNQAFSIIAEPGISVPNSRSGSPTGRVSPFRGRGFNPSGSRHASPAPSPPPGGELPDDDIIRQQNHHLQQQLRKSSIGKSQIPILKPPRSRRSSAEDVLSPETSPPEQDSPMRSGNLHSRYSRSMINIAPRNLVKKPPPSPRRALHLKPSFVRLSPIIGSSPEAGSDQMSSPSKIPRSRSQPPSRAMSPNGITNISRTPSRTPSRPPSRSSSRPPSRSTSREPSPVRSPSKVGIKNSAFKNIPAKVDTFNRVTASSKPKVPQKPKVYSTRTNLDRTKSTSVRKVSKSQMASNKFPRRDIDDTETTDTDREPVRVIRRPSISNYSKEALRRNSRPDNNNKPSTSGYSKTQKPSTSKGSKTTTDSFDRSSTSTVVGAGTYNIKSDAKNNNTTTTRNRTISQSKKDDTGAKDNRNKRRDPKETTTTSEELSKSDDETRDAKDDDILSVTIDEIIGSQTTKIVSATTETVVKPLNIEAKLIKQSETTSPETLPSSTHPNDQPPASNPAIHTFFRPANGSVLNSPSANPITQNPPATVAPSLASVNNAESVNNNFKNVTNTLNTSVNNIEMNVKNNFNNLTPPDSDKVSKSLMDSSPFTQSAKLKQSRTVIVDEIKPIKITVREKSGDIEVQSGNFALPRSATNGIAERPLLPPNNHPPNSTNEPSSTDAPEKQGPCTKIFACCKKPKKDEPTTAADGFTVSNVQNLGAAPAVSHEGHEEVKPPRCWDKVCCKGKGGKVSDVNNKFSCFPKLKKGKEEENWAERRDSILSEPPKKQTFSMTLRKIFCTPCAKCKRKSNSDASRRTSMMSKKKSLSSTMQPPPEDTGPKLDPSLVEHASHMRGAIPVLPVPLAWICLIFNIFVPGFGTILSGLFCLCIGKPRFSPRDTAKARFGAFLIDVIVGISQAFTVLFCLVGWGWSIWWGVIMLKIAKKHRKIEKAEKNAIEEQAIPSVNINHNQRDVERGT